MKLHELLINAKENQRFKISTWRNSFVMFTGRFANLIYYTGETQNFGPFSPTPDALMSDNWVLMDG